MRYLLVLLILAGCETSPVWYAGHPDRKVVTIEGSEISVVPRGPGKYDAIGGDTSAMPELKARQIKAVETIAACKVSAAEYIPATAILQTVCN